MIRPRVTSSAATATIRWKDVMGLPSQAPKRVRGSRDGASAASDLGSAPAMSMVSAAFSVLRNRLNRFGTPNYPAGVSRARTAAANRSPRSA